MKDLWSFDCFTMFFISLLLRTKRYFGKKKEYYFCPKSGKNSGTENTCSWRTTSELRIIKIQLRYARAHAMTNLQTHFKKSA